MRKIQLTDDDVELIVTALRNWDGYDYDLVGTDLKKLDASHSLAKRIKQMLNEI